MNPPPGAHGLLGYLRFEGRAYWIHAWVQNYAEVEIGDSIVSCEQMAEVAFDVGVQLGRGHVRQIAAPLDEQLRREQTLLIERDAEKIRALCQELAIATVQAWERFRSSDPMSP